MLMKTRRFLLIAVTALAVIFNQPTSGPLHAQTPAASALAGQVTSTEEGPMEGVVVSAKKDGSTIGVSVVPNAQGRLAFPAARLGPGHYTLKALGAGNELDGVQSVDVAAGQEAKVEIKLKKVKNLSAHLTNAEWLLSIPGNDEQKNFLLNCTGCHTLERIMKSTYDADGFMDVIRRMSLYYPGSTPLKPQRLSGTATRDVERGGSGRKTAEWLATINLSQEPSWPFPLKTLPRLTGKSTHVIVTEYDLPNPLIQPHDVMLDREGNVWYSDFGQMFLGKMDPKTGKVTQYPIPVVKPGWPEGTLDLEFDRDGNPWVGVMYQNAIARFDAKTKNPTVYVTPTPDSRPRRGRVDPQGRVWFAEYQGNAIGMFDPKTERMNEWKVPTPWSAPYDALLDRNGDAWTGSMLTDRIARLDSRNGQYTEYMLPRSTNIRRVYVDDSKNPGALWVGNNHGASIVKGEPPA